MTIQKFMQFTYVYHSILTNVLKRLVEFVEPGHSFVGDYCDPIRSTGVAIGVSSEAQLDCVSYYLLYFFDVKIFLLL